MTSTSVLLNGLIYGVDYERDNFKNGNIFKSR